MILIIKHISIEGPGRIEPFFERKSYRINTIELSLGDKLPEEASGIAGVISLGGPMNVYEMDKYGFLKDEEMFIRKVLKAGIPFLGICLGAQLLAKVSGATIHKAPREEIGFYEVTLTSKGTEDALFTDMDGCLEVFQWHEDTFSIPKGAHLLATSKLCRNQAFRAGKNAYGIQFHIEVEEHMIKQWVREYLESSARPVRAKSERMLRRYDQVHAKLEENAYLLCTNFERLINYSGKRGLLPSGKYSLKRG